MERGRGGCCAKFLPMKLKVLESQVVFESERHYHTFIFLKGTVHANCNNCNCKKLISILGIITS